MKPGGVSTRSRHALGEAGTDCISDLHKHVGTVLVACCNGTMEDVVLATIPGMPKNFRRAMAVFSRLDRSGQFEPYHGSRQEHRDGREAISPLRQGMTEDTPLQSFLCQTGANYGIHTRRSAMSE